MSTYLLQILIFSEIYTLIFITLKTIVTVFTGASKRAFFTARTFFFFVVESTYARINTAGVTITWINTVIQMSFDCTKVQWPDKIWPVVKKGIFCKLKFYLFWTSNFGQTFFGKRVFIYIVTRSAGPVIAIQTALGASFVTRAH